MQVPSKRVQFILTRRNKEVIRQFFTIVHREFKGQLRLVIQSNKGPTDFAAAFCQISACQSASDTAFGRHVDLNSAPLCLCINQLGIDLPQTNQSAFRMPANHAQKVSVATVFKLRDAIIACD